MNREYLSPPYTSKGMTLIEIAIVLVIVGLLIGLGATLLGNLTKRAKLAESREVVNQAKEAFIGYVVRNGYLPPEEPYDPARPVSAFDTAGAKGVDAWSRPLRYIAASELNDPNRVCGVNATGLTVTDKGSSKSNIAFIIVSSGGNYNIQTERTIYETDAPNIDDFTNDINRPTDLYDDIVVYASLDEIKSLAGCPQPLTITSPSSLPEGEEDSFYSYNLQATGGRSPFRWESKTLSCGLNLNNSGLISGTVNCNNLSLTGELGDCQSNILITTRVSDSANSPNVDYNGSITVRPKPLKIITETLPVAYEGSSYKAQIIATGGKIPYEWSMTPSPSCPTGLVCDGNTISGTPSSGSSGTYSILSKVNDTCNNANEKMFALTINPSGGGGSCPSFNVTPSPGVLPGAMIGSNYSQSILVSGGTPPTSNITCSPTTCNGLNLSCGASGATILGTPISSGTCSFNIIWQDSCSTPEHQTAGGTYMVPIGSLPSPPTCTLSATSQLIGYNSPASLIWTITNGPAHGSFYPSSGSCTSFYGSGGSCTTGPLTAPPCSQTFTLTVSNGSGSSSCSAKVYVGRNSYKVWNDAGTTMDYMVDGFCRNNVQNNREITQNQRQLNVGETITQYQRNNSCLYPTGASLNYNTAAQADSLGDCDGEVNFSGTDR